MLHYPCICFIKTPRVLYHCCLQSPEVSPSWKDLHQFLLTPNRRDLFFLGGLHSLKLTACPWKLRIHENTSFLLGWPIFRGYVSLPEGIQSSFYTTGYLCQNDQFLGYHLDKPHIDPCVFFDASLQRKHQTVTVATQAEHGTWTPSPRKGN